MDRFWRSIRHITAFHTRMCILGFCWYTSPFRGQIHKNRNFGGVYRHFQAKRVKYSNFRIISRVSFYQASVMWRTIWQFVCRSVGVCKVYCGKTVEWIRMPLGIGEWGQSRLSVVGHTTKQIKHVACRAIFKYVVPQLKCRHSTFALVLTFQPRDNIFKYRTHWRGLFV